MKAAVEMQEKLQLGQMTLKYFIKVLYLGTRGQGSARSDWLRARHM